MNLENAMAQVIDGKKVAAEIKEEIALEVAAMKKKGLKTPHLAAILVGQDGASESYVSSKEKACDQVGFKSTLIRYPSDLTEAALLAKIEEINNNPDIDGLIVQLPLPKHINEQKITQAINPSKDVDGFHAINLGLMMQRLPAFISATPYGITLLLERYKIPTEGKHCVVLGRSNIVGMPMSILMGRNTYPGNCTVTLCHSKTQNLEAITRQADILIVAIGKPEFVKANMVKEGAVVIDVGIHRMPDDSAKGYRIIGDVSYNEVALKAGFITPVPGGVGAMTIVALLKNTLIAALNRQ
jgi:methylenetetrahydrofolate dehydrogenase (NADP+)/methenyltetrahydrofolate cyclohydrolase